MAKFVEVHSDGLRGREDERYLVNLDAVSVIVRTSDKDTCTLYVAADATRQHPLYLAAADYDRIISILKDS